MFRRDEASIPPEVGPSTRLFTTGWFDLHESRSRQLVELGVAEFFRYQAHPEFKEKELGLAATELYRELGLGRPHIAIVSSPNAFINEVYEYVKLRSYLSSDFPDTRMFYMDHREVYQSSLKRINRALDEVCGSNVSGRVSEITTRALADLYRFLIMPTLATSMRGDVAGLLNLNEIYQLLGKALATFIVLGRNSEQWYYYRGHSYYSTYQITESIIRLLLGSFFFVPFIDICFIIRKPTSFIYQGQGTSVRLHNNKGPVLTFADNQKVYIYKGIQVPGYVIEQPEKITVTEILDERNVEQRRIKLERYGFSRFMLDAGAKVVDEYQGEVEGLKGAKLHEITLGSVGEVGNAPEMLKMVSVIDSTPENGEYRTYFLRVPPNMRTAEEAVAWTWGLEPEQYQPIQEA